MGTLADALNSRRVGGRQPADSRPARQDAASNGRELVAKRHPPVSPRAPRVRSPATRLVPSASPLTIIVRPTAPRQLSTGRYSLEGARESWEAGRSERQAKTLAMLRQAFAEGEEALIGWPAVTLFLHRHGVRNAYGKQVTAAVLRRWRRRFGFPLLQGRWKRTPPLTSTYLVLAWLVSLMRSGEPDGVAVAKVERGG